MKLTEILRFCKIGIETFLSSIQFFYGHMILLIISFVPSLIRAFQMWFQDTPLWLEVIVGLARVLLFLVIISIMSNHALSELRQKKCWEKIAQTCSLQFEKNWPYGFISQIFAFIILLYGLGNLLIVLFSSLVISALEWSGINITNPTALYNAWIYFLKNMSVIPLAIVFILKMCGMRATNS